MAILVSAAASKTGREVVRALAELDLPVRRGLRRPSGPGEVALDLSDPTTWDAALGGVSAVFLLRPPAIADIDATLAPFIAAARAAGVRHILFLSVAGAERNRFLPHSAVERALIAGPRDWTLLRPGFFAQNLEDAYRRDIAEDDRLYVPAGRGRVAFVDLRDVGDLAARILAAPEPHLGQAYTLTGPVAATFTEVAEALSAAAGREIRYRPASILGYARHLRRRGAPWGLVAVQTYLHVGLRFGQAEAVDPTLSRLLGHPARSIFDYVRDHPALWAAADRSRGES